MSRGRVHSPIGGHPILAHRVQGHPGRECRGACVVFWALCPPEAWPVKRYLKEHVSKRGHRVVFLLANPRGLQSERCDVRESSMLVPQGDIRCVPRFLTGVPPAARGRGPLDPRLPWHVGFEQAG